MHRTTKKWCALGLMVALGSAFSPMAGAAPTEKPRPSTHSPSAASHSERVIFNGGDESLNGITYHSFRIPSLIRTKDNTLIAFAEGRADGNGDFGNINLVYKRSTDNGKTWSDLSEVQGNGPGVWGNPTAVVDQSNGKIWLFMNHQPEGSHPVDSWDDRQTWVSSSTDDGETWSDPKDLTEQVKPKNLPTGEEWTWDAAGPGVGIQTTVENPGRLVIPATHRHIYSDDHGETWQSEVLTDGDGNAMLEGNESTVTELTSGELYRNDRAGDDSIKKRHVSTGQIGGSFSPYSTPECLLDPVSQGSVTRYNTDDPARIAFVNSASSDTRTKMRIRISEDEGKTWDYSRSFADAPLPEEGGGFKEGGYSSIAKTADYHIGALVEANENIDSNDTSHRSIAFRKVNLDWIKGGQTGENCDGGIS